MRQAVVDLASQPIRNYAYMPRGVGAPTGYGTQTLTPGVAVTGAPHGATTALRVAYGSGSINNPGAILAGSTVRAGQMFYCQADVLVESGETTSMGWALASQVGQTTGLSTFVAGVWTRATWVLTPPANADGRPIGFRLASRPGAVAGSFLITNVMITTDREPPGGYADGDTPGWRWTGADDVSESVGYPYTLASIAGQPIAQITGVGSAPLTLAQMPALSDRSTYVVTDRLAIGGAGVAARFARGVQGAGGADMRADGPLGLYTFRPQYDGGGGGGGGVYGDGYTTVVPAAGTRNVHCAVEMAGLTAFEHIVNGGAPEGRTGMNAGTGHQAPGLVTELGTVSAVTYESPVFAVQYVGAHDLETRRRIIAWLARQYGSPIPAGY